jgi:hypothetical protein
MGQVGINPLISEWSQTMGTKKVKPVLGYKPMPHEDALRVGIKVQWHYYKDKVVAEAAGKIARHNAEIDAAQGYDFGYQSPGSVRLIDEGQYKGLYEVCAS